MNDVFRGYAVLLLRVPADVPEAPLGTGRRKYGYDLAVQKAVRIANKLQRSLYVDFDRRSRTWVVWEFLLPAELTKKKENELERLGIPVVDSRSTHFDRGGKATMISPKATKPGRDPNPFSKSGYYALVNRNGYEIVHFKTRKEALAAKKSGGYSEPGDSSYWPKVVYRRGTLSSLNW